MASLIPGYEYDIFISYRQKDNKGDRWVSEFVDALKTELESTFKEEVSVYFDINPHDGLLETHDVDASLKEKLKCLVFIPVLSRTYCDPNSFAWENEFEAFVEQASSDQFGLNIKLSNGNITSRVLPVRIHDLDSEDIRLLKTQIDIIHPVDFIYYSEGVNRPLRKQDITVQDLKQLIYCDQINKTALTIKEIILGIKGEPGLIVEKKSEIREQERKFYGLKDHSKSTKQKLLIGAGILTILIIVAMFIYPGLIGRHNLKTLIAKDGRIPIAVMPFQNMTNDTALDVWQDGIQSILITSLSNSRELHVRQVGTITSILKSKGLTDYASLTPSVAGLISKKLETSVHIQGSMKQSGNTTRLNAQLINTKTGEAFKSFQIDGTADNILPAIDSLSRMVQDFLLISVLQKEDPDSEHYPPVLIKSPDAYKCIIYGEKAFTKLDYTTAIDMFMQALKIDSTIYHLYGGISAAYANQSLYEQAKEWCHKGYRKLDMMDIGNKLWTNYMYNMYFKTPNEAIRYAEEMIDFDDQDPGNYYTLGDTYWTMHQYDKAIPGFEKALEIYKKWDSKPWIINYTELGDSYHGTGQYKKEKTLYRKAEQDFPNDRVLSWNQAILAFTEEDTVAANRYIQKYIYLCKDQSWSEARITRNLADVYSNAGYLNKALELYRKSLSLESESSLRLLRLNVLSYFLIDKDRNVVEGMELVERALESNPENYDYLHTKGWGLYKQGHYKEAFDILQKSWDLRMENALYDHTAFLHLEAAKKAVAGLK